MHLKFSKYQGAGNDFVMIDNRSGKYSSLKVQQREMLCDRHFGIGADGLILIQHSLKSDFEMVYFNADGRLGSMCGNGARCAVLFSKQLGMIGRETLFMAYDGLHSAKVSAAKALKSAIVSVSMSDVSEIKKHNGNFILNTGSPHYVKFVDDTDKIDVVKEGKKIRNGNTFKAKGINVNFVSFKSKASHIRTYERGVEDETLACGTGITASAIAAHYSGLTKKLSVNVIARGGSLNVTFQVEANKYKNVMLTGSAMNVFDGEIKI
ncbi:MAG TPA: diaminopimelate epimerase [Bacteroidia bacterium]|nr:diaminopimelate epimerase [Bacteroidia bacterium]